MQELFLKLLHFQPGVSRKEIILHYNELLISQIELQPDSLMLGMRNVQKVGCKGKRHLKSKFKQKMLYTVL